MKNAHDEKLANAIEYSFTSPNEADSNLETANIVDGIYRLARAIDRLGNNDAATSMGGMEALGLAIKEAADTLASSIEDLANAIREHP